MSRIVSNIWECLERISSEKTQCCVCGVFLPRIFQNKIEDTNILEEHLLKIHNIRSDPRTNVAENLKLECTKCNFWSPIQSYLELHMKSKHTKRVKSLVWNHFSKLPTNRVECLHCGQTYNNTSGNTSAMRKHLTVMHSDKVPENDVIEKHLPVMHSDKVPPKTKRMRSFDV